MRLYPQGLAISKDDILDPKITLTLPLLPLRLRLGWACDRRIIPCMVELLEQQRDRITAICRKHGVRKLELFGSAAREDFDSDLADSDIDFFYEFDDDPARLADRFFGLQEDLEALLGRAVDLVSSRDARNPYFLQVANRHRVTLYAA